MVDLQGLLSRTAFAPGRVNLLGEHTDYNGGLALPFAIERGVTVTAEPADDAGAGDDAFVRGVLAELGSDARVRLRVESDLPMGAGLASSAAYCVALALAIGGDGDRLALAKLCSRVENDWVGARTGLLDQIAALFGRPGHVLRIDFAALAITPVPLDLQGWQLAIADSGARHDHAAGGYNLRRRECEQGHPARLRHVATENARVEAAIGAAPERLAQLLDDSHASLRDDFEVSTPEVEATIARLKRQGAAGARIHGGGFGGGVLALFGPATELPPDVMPVRPASSARVTANRP